jgi:hypothetical protein
LHESSLLQHFDHFSSPGRLCRILNTSNSISGCLEEQLHRDSLLCVLLATRRRQDQEDSMAVKQANGGLYHESLSGRNVFLFSFIPCLQLSRSTSFSYCTTFPSFRPNHRTLHFRSLAIIPASSLELCYWHVLSSAYSLTL